MEADAKANESNLSLVATTDAKPFSGPIRIIPKDAAAAYPVMHELISAGEDNGVPTVTRAC